MDAIDLATFNEAVRLAQSGQSAYAYDNLSRLSELYPNDTNVLLWLAFTAPDPYISQQAIARIELVEPHNPSLPAAKEWLAQLENTLPLATSAARAATSPVREDRSPQPPQSWEENHASAQTMQAVPVATESRPVEVANSLPATPTIAIVRIPPPIVIGQPPVLPPPARSNDTIPPAKPGRGKRKR